MDVRKEFEQKYARQEMVKLELDAYMREREEIAKTLNDLVITEKSIDDIVGSEKGANVLTNIGSGTFIPTKISDVNKVFVSVGSGIVIDVKPTKAKEILSERIEKLRKIDFEYAKKANEFATELEQLQTELETLSKQLK